MDEKYEVSELVRVVPVERVTLVSTRGFDDVVAACCWRRNAGHQAAGSASAWPHSTRLATGR